MVGLGGAQSTYTTSDVWIASDNNIVNDPSEFSFNPPTQYSNYVFDQLDSVDIRSPYQLQNSVDHPSPVVFYSLGVSNTSLGPGTRIDWGNHPDHNGEFLSQLLGTTGITNTTTISRSAINVYSAIGAQINYSITAFSENLTDKYIYLEKFGGPLDANDRVEFTPRDDNVVINTGSYTVNYDSYYTLGVDANNYDIQLTSNSNYPGGSGHGVPKGVKVTIETDWTIFQGGIPHSVLFTNNRNRRIV